PYRLPIPCDRIYVAHHSVLGQLNTSDAARGRARLRKKYAGQTLKFRHSNFRVSRYISHNSPHEEQSLIEFVLQPCAGIAEATQDSSFAVLIVALLLYPTHRQHRQEDDGSG